MGHIHPCQHARPGIMAGDGLSVLPELADYPNRFNVADVLIDQQVAAGYSDTAALIFGEETWTYTDPMHRANRTVNVLSRITASSPASGCLSAAEITRC